jgi:hypothetical protein
MIDLRHDENPPEMRCLLAIRRDGERLEDKPGWQRELKGWIASVFPSVQGNETRLRGEKLLCGA